jgi:hypothetical protein
MSFNNEFSGRSYKDSDENQFSRGHNSKHGNKTPQKSKHETSSRAHAYAHAHSIGGFTSTHENSPAGGSFNAFSQ